jgi:hypothetical protein
LWRKGGVGSGDRIREASINARWRCARTSIEERSVAGVGQSGDQCFERLDEDRSLFRFELIQCVPELGLA